MPRWLAYTLTCTAIWGIWGLVSAVVAREVSPLATQVVSTLGVVPAALLLFLSPGWRQGANLKLGIVLAALTSLSGTAGNLCMLRALSLDGPVSIVLPVAGMFPLITALMAMVLLRERLNRVQIAGFFLAAAAIYLSGQAPGASVDGSTARHSHGDAHRALDVLDVHRAGDVWGVGVLAENHHFLLFERTVHHRLRTGLDSGCDCYLAPRAGTFVPSSPQRAGCFPYCLEH